MDATEAAKALTEWAVETCPELTNAYSHNADSISAALPVAVASVGTESGTDNDPRLGIEIADFGIEQADLHVMTVDILLMVQPKPTDIADEELRGFVRELRAALKADETLSGRVPAASRFWDASYEPPYMEFDDGTVGRVATFSLAIAELD